MSMTDFFWLVLGGVALLVGSASGILLLVAVVKWLFRRPQEWEREAGDDEGPPQEVEETDDLDTGDPEAGDTDLGMPPPGVRVPAARERTRRLVATSDVFYANLLSGVLRDAGIWSFVHGNADAVGATGVPATSLYVAEDDIERARKVIAEVEASARQRRMDRQQVFNCPGCGYDLRATRDRCPECGLAL